MNYYFVIDADSSNHNTIKQKIHELLRTDETMDIIYSIRSSRNFEDIENSISGQYKPIIDESSWDCIAGVLPNH